LAKELVRSRKAVTRLLENRATLDALDMQIADSLRNYRLSKTIKASGEMMKTMNKLVKLPQLQNTVKEMSREMEYAGFVSECMNDAIDAAVDREDYDELADEAVDQVLLEICGDTLSEAATVPLAKVKTLERKEKDMEADDDELMRQIIAGEI
jgi:charged multivesicular body protein 3